MRLFVSFSARHNGNCGSIARHMARKDDQIVFYADLQAHACASCAYECFGGVCRYRDDGVYELYRRMTQAEQVILLVPMYGGNPASLYFAFCERGQDFFADGRLYAELLSRLYIIGIYGSEAETPDFLPTLRKWFADTPCDGRVLGLERHAWSQRMADSLLDEPEARKRIDAFLP